MSKENLAIEAASGMGWLEFTASIVGSIAWPIAAVVIAMLFRRQIKALLDKVKSLSWGDAKADFSDRLEEAEVAAEESLPQVTSDETRSGPSQFEQLLDVYPAAAILESWSHVELAIMERHAALGHPYDSRQGVVGAIVRLVRNGAIDQATADSLQELRALRNTAAHSARDGDITVSQAIRFQELAERSIAALRSYTI
jgi:Domain of unknown function (DUF4145)